MGAPALAPSGLGTVGSTARAFDPRGAGLALAALQSRFGLQRPTLEDVMTGCLVATPTFTLDEIRAANRY